MTDMMRELCAEELDSVSGGEIPGDGIALTGISALIIQNAATIIALQPQGGCHHVETRSCGCVVVVKNARG
jgi:hypothetical protein